MAQADQATAAGGALGRGVGGVGALAIETVRFVGGSSLLLRDALGHAAFGLLRGRPVRWREFASQCLRVGPRSLLVVFLVNFFVGMILALIGGNILQALGFTRYVGNLMSVGVVVELGPLLTGIIMTGYIGAALTAEIGTMVVTEEITALETMALNPKRYVVAPRLLATIAMVPCVTLLGDAMGLLGGHLVADGVLGISPETYYEQGWEQLQAKDVWRGLFKSVVFGAIVGTVGCYQGFQVRGGAEGVGRATTNSVVTAIIAIIVTDAIMNYFLLYRL